MTATQVEKKQSTNDGTRVLDGSNRLDMPDADATRLVAFASAMAGAEAAALMEFAAPELRDSLVKSSKRIAAMPRTEKLKTLQTALAAARRAPDANERRWVHDLAEGRSTRRAHPAVTSLVRRLCTAP